jgi:dUTP pyrophosphatase
MRIFFKKLVPEAKLPTQGKRGDAAFDLSCVEAFDLHAGETKGVSTGLQLAEMPAVQGDDSLFLQVEGRSGLALKGITPLGGIIDATYRGEIKVILHNLSNVVQSFKAGDRIAQLIVRKIVTNDSRNVVEMVESQEVSETSRGSAGFGSTGK